MTSVPANEAIPGPSTQSDILSTSHGPPVLESFYIPGPSSHPFPDAFVKQRQPFSGPQSEDTQCYSTRFTDQYPNRKRRYSGDLIPSEANSSISQVPHSSPYTTRSAYINSSSKKMKLSEQSSHAHPDFPLHVYPPASSGTIDVFGNAHQFTVNGGTFNISHSSTTTHSLPPESVPNLVTDTTSLKQSKDPLPLKSTTPVSLNREQGTTPTSACTSDSMLPSDIPTWTESELYARLLIPKGHGYPLWIPEPYEGVSPEYQLDGIRIGDVGIVNSDGGFQFLFNVCHSSQSPINRDGVPENFVPFPSRNLNILQQPTIFDRDTHITSTHIRRRTVSGGVQPERIRSVVSFESSRPEGAILALPEGGSRSNAQNFAKLRQYAVQNARSWYRYANGQRGWEIQNDALYLVTGCDKCTCWAMASFSDGPSEENTSLELATILEDSDRDDGGGRLRLMWKNVNSTAAVRTGPRQTPAINTRNRPNNQGVFVRGFKIAIGQDENGGASEDTSLIPVVNSSFDGLFGKGTHIPYGLDSGYYSSTSADTESTPSSDSSSHPGGSQRSNKQVALLQFPGSHAIFHPSDIINRYLLSQTRSTKVAITHDDEWCSVMNENEAGLPTEKELLERIRDRFSVQFSDGGVSFHPRHSLSYQLPEELEEAINCAWSDSEAPELWNAFLQETEVDHDGLDAYLPTSRDMPVPGSLPDLNTPDLTPDLIPSSLVSPCDPYDVSPSSFDMLRTPENHSLSETVPVESTAKERHSLENGRSALNEDFHFFG